MNQLRNAGSSSCRLPQNAPPGVSPRQCSRISTAMYLWSTALGVRRAFQGNEARRRAKRHLANKKLEVLSFGLYHGRRNPILRGDDMKRLVCALFGALLLI